MSNMRLGLLKSNHAASTGFPGLIPHLRHAQKCCSSEASKFHEDRQVDPVLDLLQIRRKTRHKCSRRPANIFDDRSSRTGRCNSSRSREVGRIRRAVIKLPAKSNVLAGHVVKCSGSVPCLELVPGIFRKVGRARSRRRSIDRREEHEVATPLVYFAAPSRQTIVGVVEAKTVLHHKTKATFLRNPFTIVPTAHTPAVSAS